jgi:hypothetical protein
MTIEVSGDEFIKCQQDLVEGKGEGKKLCLFLCLTTLIFNQKNEVVRTYAPTTSATMA